MMPRISESRGRRVFAVDLPMLRSLTGEYASPFFPRSHRRERLAELKFNFESCFIDAREIQNGSVVNEQCVT